MARFYQIALNTIYLTSDGTSGNPDKCKLSIAGIEAVLLPFHGSTIVAIDGTTVTQLIEANGKGKLLEIKIEMLTKAVWDQLRSLIHTALTNSDTIHLVGTGDPGNFDINVIPQMPTPYSFEGFINGRIRNVSLRFITT